MAFEDILIDLKNKKYKSIYWLEGEESYFIDEIMNFAEHKILTESEASFNLNIFYGKDADWAEVLNACKQYPMFSDKKVVLLKEAQSMKEKELERLESYIINPLSSTILFVSHKEKKVDGKTKFAKVLKTKTELLTTKKLYANQLPDWARGMIQKLGLNIEQKALMLLVDHIGNDLSRIQNEIEKLAVNLKGRTTITEDDIERYIGISKEFNVFELQDAIGKRNFDSRPQNVAVPCMVIRAATRNFAARAADPFPQERCRLLDRFGIDRRKKSSGAADDGGDWASNFAIAARAHRQFLARRFAYWSMESANSRRN